MAKSKITRTYGPIHFEDLDPHRFEDLIRELIYDFKDWQTIEATGRGGSDDGFDIRAYEKAEIIITTEEQNEAEQIHPMEGNFWMIQGKREKEIGPKKIKKILFDVDEKNPPYGYILAASVNFSKKSYDLFREELKNKGIMEFFLWGKAELEDMLHLPKNDRILFTFFGVSLVSKRRSRSTEVRSAISVKNKLFKCIGEGQSMFMPILVRDLKDLNYPYEKKYKDFKIKPRWKEYVAFGHHQLGLLCHIHEYFAYIDTEKKEWDYTREVDLINRRRDDEFDSQKKSEKINLIKDFWDLLPIKNKTHFCTDGLIKYSDIAIVDDKGDIYNNFPHIYVDFLNENGPFAGFDQILKYNNKEEHLSDEYKQVKIFPKKFSKKTFKKFIKTKKITLNDQALKKYNEYELEALYDIDDRYNFLKPKDVIQIEDNDSENYIQITHIFKSKTIDHINDTPEPYKTKNCIQVQLKREIKDSELINIYEFIRVYKWQLENKKD